MPSTHKHIRSSTANKRPTTAIADGQIAMNTNSTSPGLFFKDSTGATIIKIGPVHVGATAPNVSPASGGSSGNSTGEVWLDTSLTPNGVKIWNGSSWTNATPIGSTTVQGLLELATNAETQTGTDIDRAVTPAGLQSKVSDSVSTTSSTTIASSTAVKAAYDLAAAAVPLSGGTVTGNLEIGTTGSLSFEGATADGFETTLAVTNPTADRTITLPNVSGTVVTTGDTGTVTSTMIANGTIVDADVSASAEIAVSKLADGAARQLLQTDAAGTGVEWTSNVDVPGTLDVTSTATFDSIISASAGAAATPSITFTGDTNTGIYSPGAYQVAISTNGTGRLFVDASGNVQLGGSSGFFFTAATNQIAIGGNTYTKDLTINKTDAAIALRASSGGTYSSQGLFFYVDGTAQSQIHNDGSGNILFRNTSALTERARIDSSGRLLVGTSTAIAATTLTPGFQHQGTEAGFANAGFGRWTNDSGGYAMYFAKSRGTSLGSQVIVNDGDFLGALFFEGSDGTQLRRSVSITANVDGTPGTSDMPGRIVLSTTADGAASPTERWRITNDGVVCYNQPAPTSKSAAATLTVAELKTGIIQYTGAAATLTLPTGTLTEGGFSGIYTNMTFEWSVINTGSGLCTIGAGTGHTIVGGATVAAGASGRFASRRTAANTFVTYRLS